MHTNSHTQHKQANLDCSRLSEHTRSTPFSLRKKKGDISSTIWHFPFQRGCFKQTFSYNSKQTHIYSALLERIWEWDGIGQIDIYTSSKLYLPKNPVLSIFTSLMFKENLIKILGKTNSKLKWQRGFISYA